MFEILTPNLLVPYIFFYQVMQSLTNNMTDLKSKIIIWDETNCYIFMWFNCCIFYIIGHDLTTQIDAIINILYSKKNVQAEYTNIHVLYVFHQVKRLCRKRKSDNDQVNDKLQWKLHICSENNFPTAAGLASSAAGYACLGE